MPARFDSLPRPALSSWSVGGGAARRRVYDEENGLVEYTLSFTPETDTEAVIIPPDGYESWLPTGYKNEDTPSPAPLIVRVELRLKNKPGKTPPERAKFKFELVETSREPGLATARFY